MQVTVVRCISCNTLYIVLCSWHNAHICTLWNGFINLDLHVMQIAHVMLYNAHCCTLNDLWCTLHKVHCGVLSESFSLNVICISLGTYCWLHFSGHILQQICRGGEVDSNVQLSTLKCALCRVQRRLCWGLSDHRLLRRELVSPCTGS